MVAGKPRVLDTTWRKVEDDAWECTKAVGTPSVLKGMRRLTRSFCGFEGT